MPLINYIEFDGKEYSVNVAEGVSLMQGALDNMIDGIVAECGGCCVCCTCHCMIDPAWIEAAGLAAADESELLEMLDVREETSRLSCQVKVTSAMEGMIVRLPESQY
ncbi:2Fe-2S iron-sulfur cluster-binding protein [bacterium]|nr:2Fe-2S iron-sulfur cluster-binding protein [bacterium]